jgi:hypothetical protein
VPPQQVSVTVVAGDFPGRDCGGWVKRACTRQAVNHARPTPALGVPAGPRVRSGNQNISLSGRGFPPSVCSCAAEPGLVEHTCTVLTAPLGGGGLRLTSRLPAAAPARLGEVGSRRDAMASGIEAAWGLMDPAKGSSE